MTTVEEALFYQLSNDSDVTDVVGTRIFPNVIPQDATLPAVAYQRVSGPRLLAHDGPTGYATGRFQLTCTGSSYSSVKEAVNALRGSLDGLSETVSGVEIERVSVEGEVDGFNEAPDKHTVRLDVMIAYIES